MTELHFATIHDYFVSRWLETVSPFNMHPINMLLTKKAVMMVTKSSSVMQ